MDMQTQNFINKYALDAAGYDLESMLGDYIKEMQKGLDGKSSLQMIPSYIKFGNVKKDTPVCIIDAGGTNLRIARVQISAERGFELLKETKKMPMPGTKGCCTKQEFFELLAEECEGYAQGGDSVAFSFSFPASALENLDAEVIVIDKEVKLTGMQGVRIGEELKKAFREKGTDISEVVVINDSVATCLAGITENEGKYDSFAGVIIGTGLNTCYFEKCENAGKLAGHTGEMLINTESGSYSNVPVNDIDAEFDKTLVYPGRQLTEMQISGGYLGPLFALTLKKAASEGIIKNFDCAALETKDMDDLLRGRQGVLSEILDEKDTITAKAIATAMIKRAAFLSAMQIVATAIRTEKKNICFSVEGSTYYNLCGFKEQTDSIAKKHLKKSGINADFLDIDDAVLKGCAISVLMK